MMLGKRVGLVVLVLACFAGSAIAEDITNKMPRVEKGKVTSPLPAPKKEPSAMERAVKESPVQPAEIGPERKRREDTEPAPGVKVTIPTK